MESRQKYIEVDIPYEIEETFVDAVMELTSRERLHVFRQIRSAIDSLEYSEEETFEAASHVGHDLFYKFEYYNMEDWPPVLLNFWVIDTDEYLDMMIDKKLILE
jgi:hypothetical protein